MEGIVHLSFLSKGASFLPICHAESMQAAVTENPNLGSVTKKHLFLAVLEAGRLRSKHRWMQRLVSPTLWSTDSCLLIVSSPARRSKSTFWGLFKKGTNPIHAGEATLVTSLPPRSPTSKNHHIWGQVSTYNLSLEQPSFQENGLCGQGWYGNRNTALQWAQ